MIRSFVRTLLAFVASLFVVAAAGQVPMVAPSSGLPGWVAWIVGAALIAVGLWFYFRKHPQALANAEAHLNLAHDLSAALNRAHGTIDTLAAKVPTPSAPPVAAPAPRETAAPPVPMPPTAAAPGVPSIPVAPPSSPPARNPQSNAPAGYPDTSPGGYPLWYPIGGDGKPTGPARLIYDGNTFGSESEIAAYRTAVALRNLNLAAYQAPAFVGTVPMSSLTPDDWCYIDARADLPWSVILSGDADMFKAQTVHYYYNGLASFNPTTYAGPLKQYG